ncbi:hypothetical protein ACR9LY_06135 [Helicobacter pylori]
MEQTFLKIIEKKHEELNLGQDYNAIFSKIRDFEANAIGQIGEEFLKSVLNAIDEVINDGIIHLVPMNPDNQVNYKLTLNIKELKEIANLIKELERILELD